MPSIRQAGICSREEFLCEGSSIINGQRWTNYERPCVFRRLHLMSNEWGWKFLYWGEGVTSVMGNDKISSWSFSRGISFKLCFNLRSEILVKIILIKTQLLPILIFVFLLRVQWDTIVSKENWNSCLILTLFKETNVFLYFKHLDLNNGWISLVSGGFFCYSSCWHFSLWFHFIKPLSLNTNPQEKCKSVWIWYKSKSTHICHYGWSPNKQYKLCSGTKD